MLSLGSWPMEAKDLRHSQMTPITKRIISQVKIDIKQLLPISLDEYRMGYSKDQKSNEGLQQDYRLQLARRNKKIAILKEIRQKYINGKEHTVLSFKAKLYKIKSIDKIKKNHKNSYIRISNKSQNESQKHSSLSNKIKSAPKLTLNSLRKPSINRPLKFNSKSDYLMPFIPHSNHNKTHLTARDQQSTRSKYLKLKDPNISNTAKQVHHQYGLFPSQQTSRQRSGRDKVKTKSKNKQQHQQLELCRELLTTMQKLERLATKHQKQIDQMKNLTTQERQRLYKIHKIEKNQLQTRLSKIKSILQSY